MMDTNSIFNHRLLVNIVGCPVYCSHPTTHCTGIYELIAGMDVNELKVGIQFDT